MNHSASVFLYRNLAREIGDKIKDSTYKPGEKLPSTRELHKKLNLSISTVYRAYIELEQQGLIEARPKSGYYVKCKVSPDPVRELSESDIPEELDLRIPEIDALMPHKIAIPSFSNQVLKVVKRGDFLQFGTAMLSPELLPYRQLNRIMKEISPRGMQSVLSYNVPQGDIELRRQLSLRSVGFLKQITAADLVITNGCTEALSLTLRAVAKADDIIAIESPAFFGILPVLEEMNLRVIEIPTDPLTGLDLEVLERAIQQYSINACLVTPNFSNPIGLLMPEERKKSLVQLLNSHEIPLIEDNTNAELFYSGKRPSLLKVYDKKDLVINCSSFSKTLAPGLRVGWIVPGARFMDKILKLKAGFSVSNSSLGQQLLADFMAQGNYDRYLRSLRNLLKKQVRQYVDAIKTHFPQGATVQHPNGGILLWVKLPEGVDSLQIYRRALEHRISILPGVICSGSGQYKNYIRIGCGYPFTRETEKGIMLLGSIIEQASVSAS